MSELDDLLAQAREAARGQASPPDAHELGARDAGRRRGRGAEPSGPRAALDRSGEGLVEWAPASPLRFGERFGHVLPVEMLITDIDRRGPDVSDGLRSVLGVQTRLYSISGYGGDVEHLIGREASADRWGELWTEAEYEYLFGRFPPDGPRPTDGDVEMVAIELGRTPDAIGWQWADGAAYCGGRSASTASEPLKAWLDSRGLGG